MTKKQLLFRMDSSNDALENMLLLHWRDPQLKFLIKHNFRREDRYALVEKLKSVCQNVKHQRSFSFGGFRGAAPLTSIVIKSRFSETWRISPCLLFLTRCCAFFMPELFSLLRLSLYHQRIGAMRLSSRRFGRRSYYSLTLLRDALNYHHTWNCNLVRRSYRAGWAAV